MIPLTFLHNTLGGSLRSKKALGNDFAGWVKAAGLPDKCRMHGLKKGGMRQRAKASKLFTDQTAGMRTDADQKLQTLPIQTYKHGTK